MIIMTGDKVRKKSGKPFKSGNKVNTIKGFDINPHSGNMASSFEEDDSLVDCDIIRRADYETDSDSGLMEG